MADGAGEAGLARGLGRAARLVGVNLAVLAGLVATTGLAAELWLRATVPFLAVETAYEFAAPYGFRRPPGARVAWTNHLDYWTVSQANALGFLDRPPPGAKRPEVCRVVFLGDSFVDAPEVAIEDKLQVVFAELFRQRTGIPVETAAFGAPGTGQAAQLGHLDAFARPLRPDAVVLVAVFNDVADNAPALDAVRNGWHPDHAPRYQIVPTAAGPVERPADPDWRRHLLDPPPPAPGTLDRLDGWLRGHSHAWAWLAKKADVLRFRFLKARGSAPTNAAQVRRLEALKRLGEPHAGLLADWRFPDDLDMDAMLFAERPSAAVRQGIALTGAALDAVTRRGREDGFTVVMLATHTLSLRRNVPRDLEARIAAETGNGTADERALERLVELARVRGIPIVDQAAHIRRRGRELAQASFPHDAHWNEDGHRWAAEALAGALADEPEFCSAQRRALRPS